VTKAPTVKPAMSPFPKSLLYMASPPVLGVTARRRPAAPASWADTDRRTSLFSYRQILRRLPKTATRDRSRLCKRASLCDHDGFHSFVTLTLPLTATVQLNAA
jgi:hypothetical protein